MPSRGRPFCAHKSVWSRTAQPQKKGGKASFAANRIAAFVLCSSLTHSLSCLHRTSDMAARLLAAAVTATRVLPCAGVISKCLRCSLVRYKKKLFFISVMSRSFTALAQPSITTARIVRWHERLNSHIDCGWERCSIEFTTISLSLFQAAPSLTHLTSFVQIREFRVRTAIKRRCTECRVCLWN